MNELTNRLLSIARDLILIQSTDSKPEERRRAFQFFLNHLQGIEAVSIQRFESDGYESLLALPRGVEHPEILLCGHLDVVEHPSEAAYVSTIKNGRLYGPGAGDMKGALAILLELFLKWHHRHPGISLGLAITSDEEIGGMHGLRFLVDECALRAGIAIVPDGGSLNEITSEEKGILHQRVRCLGHAGHAARPWLSTNALQNLITKLDRLREHFDAKQPNQQTEDDHWTPTCSITCLHTPNESVNRIPDLAEASIDIRFPPPHTEASIQAEVEQVLKPNAALELETLISAAPTQLDPDPIFFELTEKVTGGPVFTMRAAGGSDARFLSRVGIPVILSRPIVGDLHSDQEWIDIQSMESYFKICDQYIAQRHTRD